MRSTSQGLIFDIRVEIARQVQIPARLRAASLPDHLHAVLRIPIARACAARSHFGLNLHGVVVFLGDPADNRSVELISESPFREDAGVT